MPLTLDRRRRRTTNDRWPGSPPGDVGRPLVPDDHGPGAAPGAGVHALELTRRQGVVLDRHGQPPDRGIERGALGHRPRAQHGAGLDPQVEV